MRRTAGNRSVLVVGSERSKVIARLVRELELVPTFVGSLQAALHALRHMRALAILVDRDQKRADDLELVLNVRDLDPRIPVLLIGATRDSRTERILSRQTATFLITRSGDGGSLATLFLKAVGASHVPDA